MLDLATLKTRNGWLALGFVLLSLCPSPLIACISSMYFAKTGQFTLRENRVPARIMIMATISVAISLSILISTSLWAYILDVTGPLRRVDPMFPMIRPQDSIRAAIQFAIELFTALTLADVANRLLASRTEKAENFFRLDSFRLSSYLGFESFSIAIDAISLFPTHPLATLGFTTVSLIWTAAIPIYELMVFIENMISAPAYTTTRAVDFFSESLSNGFAWIPVIRKWIAVLLIVDMGAWMAKRMSEMFVR